MSNQPPPAFGGHSGYTQQWPLPFPSMIPPNFAPNSDPQATAHPPLVHPSQAFEYNLASANANSHIPVPGNSSDQGVFLPPQLPFMGHFDLSRFPLPFPPIPMPSFGFSSMPAPPGSLNEPPESVKSNGTAANQSSDSQRVSRDVQSLAGSNREDGEVSEGEVAQSVISGKDAQATEIRVSAVRQPSLEEGETRSSPSSTSTRSSSRTPFLKLTFPISY